MFCSQCGAKIPDAGRFCPECGTLVAASEAAVEAEVAPPPPSPLYSFAPPLATSGPNTALSYQPPAAPAQPVAETPKKSKKKLFIVLGAVALVVLIAVGAFVGFSLWRASVYEQGVAALTEENYGEAHDLFTELGSYKDARELADTARKGLEYDAALELVRVEDYVAARDVFESLGSFKDAADQALLCQQNIDYQEAIAAFEQGDFEHAREVFSDLAANQFSDAVNWRDKSIYAIADEKYKAEDRYGAYQIFRGLGSFEDAADRAQQCTTAYPSTGELYHNPDYASSVSTLVVDGVNATYVSYYKVYDGDTLISTFFLHPGAKCNIDLPPGNYTIKESTGDAWFGEEILFGDEGLYGIMTFDGGKDYLELGRNIEVTITLSVIGELTGDTVGSSSTDREGF